MITEIAILNIKDHQSKNFEQSFMQAEKIISKMDGYVNHELLKCIEKEDQYILIVKWRNMEDHTIGFRKSKEYEDWKDLLHHFYEPFLTVEHYSTIKNYGST